MAIICLKIGENEPSSYAKFERLYKHLDIIEVLPRKRDAQGQLLDRDAGVSGRREFLCLHVDLDALTDAQFSQYRYALRAKAFENTGGFTPEGRAIFRIAHKRRYRVREVALVAILTPGDVAEVVRQAAFRRNRDVRFDLWPLNQQLQAAPLARPAFEGIVEDKTNGKTLIDAPLVGGVEEP